MRLVVGEGGMRRRPKNNLEGIGQRAGGRREVQRGKRKGSEKILIRSASSLVPACLPGRTVAVTHRLLHAPECLFVNPISGQVRYALSFIARFLYGAANESAALNWTLKRIPVLQRTF